MKLTLVKLLVAVNVIIFLFTMLDTTAVYNSQPFGSQDCCTREINTDFCESCRYETCCEYTSTDYNFALIPKGVFEKPWTIITSMFLYTDLLHLLLNIVGLIILGAYLEEVVGWKNFLYIYFIGGFIAIISHILFMQYIGGAGIHTPMVGGSGAIYAVTTALMIIHPYDTIFKLRERGFFMM